MILILVMSLVRFHGQCRLSDLIACLEAADVDAQVPVSVVRQVRVRVQDVGHGGGIQAPRVGVDGEHQAGTLGLPARSRLDGR